jgi:indolepyruvate ferredoxin oxidoreductase beta subunit
VLEKMIPEKYRDVNRRVFDRAIESVSDTKEMGMKSRAPNDGRVR